MFRGYRIAFIVHFYFYFVIVSCEFFFFSARMSRIQNDALVFRFQCLGMEIRE